MMLSATNKNTFWLASSCSTTTALVVVVAMTTLLMVVANGFEELFLPSSTTSTPRRRRKELTMMTTPPHPTWGGCDPPIMAGAQADPATMTTTRILATMRSSSSSSVIATTTERRNHQDHHHLLRDGGYDDDDAPNNTERSLSICGTNNNLSHRRHFWQQACSSSLLLLWLDGCCPNVANAVAVTTETRTTDWSKIRADIQEAQETLEKLTSNWERAVIDCTYADVPRELLEQKNKELLLEKASTFALFDKSVSVISCKTIVNTIRDYLGKTGIGPLVDIDKKLQFAIDALLLQDDNDIEELERVVQIKEDIQRELTRADSFSYSARRDFTSMNNFDPSETTKVLSDNSSNLAFCKEAIQTASDKMEILLSMLAKE